MFTIHTEDLKWSENDNELVSFDYMYLIRPKDTMTRSHSKIVGIVNGDTTVKYDCYCDYTVFGTLFRLLAIVYPILPIARLEVDSLDELNKFMEGFTFIEGYKKLWKLRGWRAGSSQEQMFELLNLQGMMISHV